MNKSILVLIIFLCCSKLAFCQLEITVCKDCYLLYNHNGKEFTKNKKIKAGSSITLIKESDLYSDFYEVMHKDLLFHINGNNLDQHDLHSYIKEKKDAILREKQKTDSVRRSNERIKAEIQKRKNDSISVAKHKRDSIESYRSDSIKREKRIFALAIYDEIKRIEKDKIKKGMPIEIVRLGTDEPNNAGGTTLRFDFKNISPKRIKYISVSGYPINAVDDKCACSIRGNSQCTTKGVGPIESGDYASYTWENTWYNHTIDKYIPTSIVIQYMEGGSVTITGSKLNEIIRSPILDNVLDKTLKDNNIDLDKIRK